MSDNIPESRREEGASECPIPQHPRGVLLAPATVVALAVLLRLWNLPDECPWYDEVLSLKYVGAPTLGVFLDRFARTGTPPLPVYLTIEYFWAHRVGDSVLSLRLLSVLLGILAVPLTYVFGKRLYGARAGIVASLCLACSMVHIYFSQEIRMYAPIPALACMSFYALYRAQHTPRARWWALHVAANALLLWTHSFTMLLIVAQGFYLVAFHVRHTARLLGWGFAHLVLLAAYALWLHALDMGLILETAACIPDATLRELAMVFLIFAGGRPLNENPRAHLPLPVSLDGWLALLMGVLVLMACWQAIRRRIAAPTVVSGAEDAATIAEASHRIEALGLLLLWAIVPPLSLYVLSHVWKPCFVYRYVLYSSLPLYLLAGGAVASMRRGPIRGFVVFLMAFLFAYQLGALRVGPFRPDWRTAGDYVNARRDPDDVILVYQRINTVALAFDSEIPERDIQTVDVWSDICRPVMENCFEGRSTWLFVWLWADTGKFERCFEVHGVKVTTREFPGWPRIRLYHIEPDVRSPGFDKGVPSLWTRRISPRYLAARKLEPARTPPTPACSI